MAKVVVLTRTLAALFVFVACLPILAVEPSEPTKTPAPEPRRFHIVLAGFFNCEDPETFSAEPITYAGMDLGAVYEHLRSLAQHYPPTSGLEILSPEKEAAFQSEQLASKDVEAIIDRVDALLKVLDEVNQEDTRATEHIKALRAPFSPSEALRPDDLLLFVMGLESPRHHGNPHVLRSVLGAFWFRGDGTNVGAMVKPYDFSKLNTESMKALSAGAFPKNAAP